MSSPLRKIAGGWKVFIAIAIGLVVSGWILYSNMNQIQFIDVDEGTGEFEWIDGNGNGVVDTHLEEDFKLSETGNYHLQTASDSLKNIDWSFHTFFWLLGAIIFTAGRDFFYMVRIRILTKNKLSWKSALYVILLWEFASAISPGVVGGAAVAMFILNREGIPFGRATAIVIITAFMDNLFYVVMIPLIFIFVSYGSVVTFGDETSTFLSMWFYGGFLIILSVCILLYLTIFWYPKLASKFLLLIFKLPFLNRWKVIAIEWGKDIELASKQFKEENRVYWFKVFGATMASWLSRYLVINAILNAFLDLGIMDNVRILGKQFVLWLFMLVTPTPGGSGMAEYAFGELLSDLGISALVLAVMALIWRLVSYFPYIFIGVILLPFWLRKKR